MRVAGRGDLRRPSRVCAAPGSESILRFYTRLPISVALVDVGRCSSDTSCCVALAGWQAPATSGQKSYGLPNELVRGQWEYRVEFSFLFHSIGFDI